MYFVHIPAIFPNAFRRLTEVPICLNMKVAGRRKRGISLCLRHLFAASHKIFVYFPNKNTIDLLASFEIVLPPSQYLLY